MILNDKFEDYRESDPQIEVTKKMEVNLKDTSLEEKLKEIKEEEKKFGEVIIRDVVCKVKVDLLQIYTRDEITIEFIVNEYDENFQKVNWRKKEKKVLVWSNLLLTPIFVYKNEGHVFGKELRSNLCLTFEIIKPKHFDFKGCDLFLRQQISLKDALLKSSLKIVNINKMFENVMVEEIIRPSTVIKIANRGFIKCDQFISNRNSDVKRGDLYLTFDISFPDFIEFEHKKVLQEILKKE